MGRARGEIEPLVAICEVVAGLFVTVEVAVALGADPGEFAVGVRP